MRPFEAHHSYKTFADGSTRMLEKRDRVIVLDFVFDPTKRECHAVILRVPTRTIENIPISWLDSLGPNVAEALTWSTSK